MVSRTVATTERLQLEPGASKAQQICSALQIPGVIPEPSILELVGIGLLGFAASRMPQIRRQRLIREAKL